MHKIKLEPDDVLRGVGSYREEVEVECPVCGDTTGFGTENEIAECDCGAEFGVEKPFN